MTAYYNEIDRQAAAWLRVLIAEGLIAAGDVDERSITEVRPDDLAGYRQCHFFAGIGGWSRALRIVGWPDDRPVWTGSVPCQPYSVASVAHGGAQGQGDERHLWPAFFGLVRECRPSAVFGEQVASAVKWGWWDEVRLDLEGEGYAAAGGVHGDTLARARRALDGDYGDLLPCNGLSVVMERAALKGYGNAIVPQVAAEFIGACMTTFHQK